jgi:hypothetical protein
MTLVRASASPAGDGGVQQTPIGVNVSGGVNIEAEDVIPAKACGR